MIVALAVGLWALSGKEPMAAPSHSAWSRCPSPNAMPAAGAALLPSVSDEAEETAALVASYILLVVCLGGGLGGLILSIYLCFAVKRKRLRRLAAQMDGTACVACGSTEIFHPKEDITVCRSCGYEGGAGTAERMRARRIELYRQMHPRLRLMSMADDLRVALQDLMNAEDALRWFLSHRPSFVIDRTGCGLSFGASRYQTKSTLEEKTAELTEKMYRVQGILGDVLTKMSTIDPSHLGDSERKKLGSWRLENHFARYSSWIDGARRVKELAEPFEQMRYAIEDHLGMLPSPDSVS